MRTLVTGGCGFIGSHLVDALIDQGHEVYVIDNLSSECNEQFYFNDNATYLEEDIRNYDGIKHFFKNIDQVFHLAAESRIQPTLGRPQETCGTNFMGTCNILELSKENNIKKLIYSSTSSGYGLKNKPPLKETMQRDCLNPYSVTKVAAEDLCKIYYNLWGLKTVSLRYFNVFGERQPIKGIYAPVVGLFIKQKKNNQPLTVVGDGLQKRDFTYVMDIVSANLKISMSDNDSIFGEVFNVGSGKNLSILDLAKMIDSNIQFVPERKAESRETLADTSKIKSVIDWSVTKNIEEWVEDQL